jgi:hypothetical protein
MTIRPTLAALSLAALAATAQAQVITIDQAKALAGNVTPGDTPGFPVTISQPGSYRLMSNLTVADVSAHGIRIEANGVTIDLNGFSITGARCVPGGRCHIGTGGAGIVGGRNVSILNGTVTQFADSGIHVAEQGSVVGVRSHRNGHCGAIVNSDSLVRDSALTDNVYCGLWISRSVARNNLISRNAAFQIHSAGQSLLSGNNVIGAGANNLPPAQSLGDNLCSPAGSLVTQRC